MYKMEKVIEIYSHLFRSLYKCTKLHEDWSNTKNVAKGLPSPLSFVTLLLVQSF